MNPDNSQNPSSRSTGSSDELEEKDKIATSKPIPPATGLDEKLGRGETQPTTGSNKPSAVWNPKQSSQYEPPDAKLTITKAPKRKKWKKPKDKPKRPLSAYNLFFQEARNEILTDEEQQANIPANSKLGFADLARSIGAKWKTLQPKDKVKYEIEAEKEQERYKRELDEWKRNQAKRKKEAKEWSIQREEVIQSLAAVAQADAANRAAALLGQHPSLMMGDLPQNLPQASYEALMTQYMMSRPMDSYGAMNTMMHQHLQQQQQQQQQQQPGLSTAMANFGNSGAWMNEQMQQAQQLAQSYDLSSSPYGGGNMQAMQALFQQQQQQQQMQQSFLAGGTASPLGSGGGRSMSVPAGEASSLMHPMSPTSSSDNMRRASMPQLPSGAASHPMAGGMSMEGDMAPIMEQPGAASMADFADNLDEDDFDLLSRLRQHHDNS